MIENLPASYQIYVREYLRTLNQVHSYRKAFPNLSEKSISCNAWRFHRLPEITNTIAAILTETYPTDQEILQKIIQLVDLDVAQYIEGNSFNIAKFKEDGYGWLVKGMKSTRYGVDVVLMDKDKAIDQLTKIYKLIDSTNHFTVEVELSAQEMLTQKLQSLNI